jgi:hypothetical protein
MARLTVQFMAALALVWPSASYACARPIFVFEPGSARFGAEQADMLDFALEEYAPGSRLRLVAFTDSHGRALAQRRGEAVKAALVRRGIPAKAIEIVARPWGGELGPVEVQISEPPRQNSCG